VAFPLLKRVNVTLILNYSSPWLMINPQKARTQAFAAVPEVTIPATKTLTKQTKCPHDPIHLYHQFYEVNIAAYKKKKSSSIRRGLRLSLPGVDRGTPDFGVRVRLHNYPFHDKGETIGFSLDFF
jgi:hypothetical protein